MKSRSLVVCENGDVLATRVADYVVDCAQQALGQFGRFTFVLAGGSTPERAYQLLAQPHWSEAIPWSKTHIFFGDERFVPQGHIHSNYRMAREALLSRVRVSSLQVFPVPTHVRTAAEAAAMYETEMARFFGLDAAIASPPHFDLILLGMGEDGHTASLFPGSPALHVNDAWVTWSRPCSVDPRVDRITLTYPVLNAARHVAFLVAGARKAAALRDVLDGKATCDVRPAAGVRPFDGAVTWFVDEEASQLLTSDSKDSAVTA